ncbi:MAG: hypothetical protein PHR19_02450 [Bacteroidales bacterium]|nr:hypothetical protein [Bacteroidales bacterium]
MTTFTANKTDAQNESFSSGAIKTGFHAGVITKAYERLSKSSAAKALHIDFMSFTGGFGSIDLWHTSGAGVQVDKNGKPLPAIAQINQLMALLGIESLTPNPNGKVEVYDWDSKSTVERRMTTYPQLVNKTIGTVWQTEEYKKQVDNGDGKLVDASPLEIKERAVWLKFCDSQTRQSAGEFINGSEAKLIDQFLVGLDEVKRVKLSPAKTAKAADTDAVKKAPNDFEFNDDEFIF